MRATLFRTTALLLTFTMTAAAQPPAGQPSAGQPPADAGGTPTVRAALPAAPDNAPTVDIFALINRLACEMNKEFIIDPRMRGIVGFSTARDDADYDTLLALLRTNGYAAIEVGDEVRIVSEATARSEPSIVLTRDDARVSDHAVVTLVIDVAGWDVTMPDGTPGSAGPVLVPVLRPMMSTAIGNIASVPGSTKLVIVDRYDNARRIAAIIEELRK